MRKHFALMATVAALAITPALAQTTTPKQDSQPAPQAQPSQPSTQTPSAAPSTTMPADKSAEKTEKAMPGEKFVTTQTSDQWLASDLMGLKVVGSNNENIGSVSDLLVDEDGNIHAAIVGVGGFLGIGQKNVAISFESFDIARDQNGNPEARLALTKQDLENAPEFKEAESARSAAQRPAVPGTSPAKPAAPRN